MGRREEFLRLDTAESQQKAAAILNEAADILDDGFHVTLVEDLRDIAGSIYTPEASLQADTPVRFSVSAAPPVARRDIVHLVRPNGSREIAVGDLQGEGIRVPAGCTITQIQIDGGPALPPIDETGRDLLTTEGDRVSLRLVGDGDRP